MRARLVVLVVLAATGVAVLPSPAHAVVATIVSGQITLTGGAENNAITLEQGAGQNVVIRDSAGVTDDPNGFYCNADSDAVGDFLNCGGLSGVALVISAGNGSNSVGPRSGEAIYNGLLTGIGYGGGTGCDRFFGAGLTVPVSVSLGNGGCGTILSPQPQRAEGSGGNDTFIGGSGDDVFIGGAGGTDVLGYSDRTAPVTVTLDGVANDGEAGEGDNVGGDVERFYLGSGNDSFTGDGDPETVDGGAGADTLTGAGGADTLQGLAGTDTLDGGSGVDTLRGGTQDDTLLAGPDNDTIVQGEDGNDTLDGGDGNDTLDGGTGNDTATGGTGIDQLLLGAGADTGDGGPGNDTLTGAGDPDTLRGGDDNDTINGGLGADPLLDGGGGNDTINGNEDDDAIAGGPGNDTITTGTGTNSVDGGPGEDTITGDSGADALGGGDDKDTITGAGANDALNGGAGDDTLKGGGGSDGVDGGPGNDTIDGEGDADPSLHGGDGDDTLTGGAGAVPDGVFGDGGDDKLFAGEGDDELRGGPGDDVLGDDKGADLLDGGEGTIDAFGYAAADNEPVSMTLDGAANDGRSGEGDNLLDLETLTGGLANDTLVGDGEPNYLNGSGGDDTIDGGGGIDVLRGNSGNDRVIGRDDRLVKDDIGCNDGPGDVAVADAADAVASDCETVDRSPVPPGVDLSQLGASGLEIGGGAGSAGGSTAPPGTGATADTTAPTVSLRGLPGRTTRAKLLKGVTLTIVVNEPAALDVRLVGTTKKASPAAVKDNLTLARRTLGRAAGSRRVRLKPTAALLGRRSKLSLKVVVVATDAAGNRRTLSRTLRVAPARRKR